MILLFIPQASNLPKVRNKVDNKSYEKLIIIKSSIEANDQYMRANKQDSDEKMKKFT